MTTLDRINQIARDALLDQDALAKADILANALKDIELMTRELRQGDKIKLNSYIRPKYLVGVHGTVVEMQGDERVKVNIDESYSTGRYSRNGLCLPLSCIERVSD